MKNPIGIMWILVVLFSGTQTTNEATTQIRDTNPENGLGKTINMHFTVILGATLHKESVTLKY